MRNLPRPLRYQQGPGEEGEQEDEAGVEECLAGGAEQVLVETALT